MPMSDQFRLSKTPRPYFWMAVLVLSLSAGISIRSGYPRPQIHDEFAYLLQADTFVNGRLTNPTPDCWQAFESFHILMQPSYQGKFPPGQGIQLAVGKWIGHPIYGVWLTLVLWGWAGIYAFQRLLPLGWAFAGAVILVLQFGVLSYHGNSYWGGSLFGLAGTLILGGTLHMLHPGVRLRDGFVLGLGLAIASLTRPFEGLLFSLVPVLTLFVAGYRLKFKPTEQSRQFVKAGVFAILCPVIAVGMHLVYNHAVTGSFSELPYSIYQERYQPGSALFPWQHIEDSGSSHHIGNDAMRKGQHDYDWTNVDSGMEYLLRLLTSWKLLFFFLLPWPLVLPILIGLFGYFKRSDLQGFFVLTLSLFVFLIPMISTSALGFLFHHYFTAWCSVWVLLAIVGLREIMNWSYCRSKPTGRWIAGGLAVWLCVLWALNLWTFTQDPYVKTKYKIPLVYESRHNIEKVLSERFENSSKHQIVFVKYDETHDPHSEWVYNGSDIRSQSVIWARWLEPEKNTELVEQFDACEFWVVEVSNQDRSIKIRSLSKEKDLLNGT